jgi:hypothetical protein
MIQSPLATILIALAVLALTGCSERKSGGNMELPFGREAQRESIQSIVEKLKDAGFVPGESATCRVF